MVGVPGQGRTFDPDRFLDDAMLLFWRQGFEGTSISDLRQVSGLTASSIYAAFGNKEAVFQATVQRYAGTYGSFVVEALSSRSEVPDRLRALLYGAAHAYAPGPRPGGCYFVNTADCVSTGNSPVAALMHGLRRATGERIGETVAQGVDEGSLPGDRDPSALTGFLVAVLQGMAQRGFDGATEAELRATADLALAACGVQVVDSGQSGGSGAARPGPVALEPTAPV